MSSSERFITPEYLMNGVVLWLGSLFGKIARRGPAAGLSLRRFLQLALLQMDQQQRDRCRRHALEPGRVTQGCRT